MTREEALEFIAQSVKSDVDMAKVADAIKVIEQDPNIRHCFGCKYSKDNHNSGTEECHLCMWENQYTPTTKNDLGVREFEGIEVTYPPEDICIYPEYKGKPYFGIKYKENGEEIVGYGTYNPEVLSRYLKNYFISTTRNLPSVSPQEPQTFKWCTDCKEYDQEKHCCHRWSKFIRDTVEEMKQEPILDRVRAEIEPKCDRINSLASVLPYTAHREIQELLCEIMDLCKAEIEVEDGNDDK